MPSIFTYDEYVDMLLIYGECGKNKTHAQGLYRNRFPHRITPSKNTFAYVERKLRTGSFPSGKNQVNRQKTAQTDDNVINILAYLQVNPHTSIRFLEQELGISRSSIQRVLKNHKYHPYKVHLTQGLVPADPERRLNFIAEMSVQSNDDPSFLGKILWSDESRFHNNGIVNRHNCHYWSQENPKWMRETNFQTIWGINVWCGLFNGRLIGPYFYEGTLTGQRYLDFLQNTLPELLEDIPLNERQTMWWQQDGASPHFFEQVREYLDNTFPGKWIGRNGAIVWPPRSPDITPLDFFLWGYLKGLVYVTPPTDLDDLKDKIRQACRTVTPEMIAAACTRNLLTRFEHCVNVHGHQFEHLL